MSQHKSIHFKIIETLIIALFSLSLSGQNPMPSDTSYFVPWDKNYNLILAVSKSDTLSIKLLLDRGADVNTSTIDGVTPLMYATDNGNLEIVKILVEHGANIDKKPFNGPTALIAASKKNFYEIAEFLVSKKANLNIRVDDGITAVNYAAALNHFDVMDMLIFYGADMEISDNKGNTPLLSASYNNSIEAADLLLQNGANIDTFDINGNSSLMIAIQRGNTDMAYLLIDKGANIHALNKAGYCPLALAVIFKDSELAENLVNMGANVNQQTRSGYSILELARISGDDDITELLKTNEAKSNLHTHFNTFSCGPYLDFNLTDYMNGIQGSILDSRFGIGFNGGFGFRPLANRILVEVSPVLSYQYWERRYYFYAGLDKKFDFTRGEDNSTGPYIGINEYLTFGGYGGSDKNPPIKFITAPQAGWYYSNAYFLTWLGYQHLDFKTPEIKPGRIMLGISLNFNLNKNKLTEKKIEWLE
jgi:ankyrin repeat protein